MQKCILASREAGKLTVAVVLCNGFSPPSKEGSNMVNNEHTDRGIVLYTLYFIVQDMEPFKIILTFVIIS